MNKKLVSFLVGNVALFISPLFLFCAILARFHTGRWNSREVAAFVTPLGISIITGIILTGFFWKNRENRSPNLARRDGIGVVGFVSLCHWCHTVLFHWSHTCSSIF